MVRPLSEIEREVLALPDIEKERLLRALFEELRGLPDPGVEQSWLDEIQRRSRELDAGIVGKIPVDQVIPNLGARLTR